ncbi:MAG TPA: adenylate/guanylate cyclase domain-containing protein [Candidatus Limnocylindrales bacterium]|nr:adenylate/guanylate cyclase domain-containing protein [Candidatus Limnocylindrales bacterium]
MSAEVQGGAAIVRTAWIVVLAAVLPLAGLMLLLARPELDLEWEHHPSHFWLVLVTAGVNVALAYVTNVAAGRYRDARLVLISLAFLASAGFLGLHALATPGVMLEHQNAGFVVATPAGLALAAVFAAASATTLAGPRARTVLTARRFLLWGLIALMVAWGVASLARLPPLDGPPPGKEGVGPLQLLAVLAVVLYAVAAWRSLRLYQLRGGTVLLSVAIAMVLLAEAMIAVVVSRNWQLSWWEWHVLMLLAFALIALGAREEYRRSGSLTGAFGGLYLEATLARIDRWQAEAIAAVAAADARGGSVDRVLARLRSEGASSDEVALLAGAADELRRLDASFQPYLPSPVAARIRQEGGPARPLGGEERVVSVVFADLAGFTTFSETRQPTEVLAMLNSFWAVVVPVIDAAGGVIEHFAGDGIMAIFNAGGNQSDHAQRAARAAIAIGDAARPVAADHPGWPIFRVGVNTGPAFVGDLGAMARRSFAAIGDATNIAARLMAAAEPGQIVVGRTTWEGLGSSAQGVELGPITVKGKLEAVEAWRLESI